VATGTFDWLHTGHVRFFEEAAQRGDLLVMVGNDANILRLKGEGHPLIGQDERVYMVAAIRHVAFAFVSSGSGWLDAEEEFRLLEPDIFVVNADGHKPEKAAFCAELGMRYEVLERRPREGLPARSSTALRGF
jgi:cytidyltransferase-like protein